MVGIGFETTAWGVAVFSGSKNPRILVHIHVMYVCMYACMNACTYVRTYVRTYECMYKPTVSDTPQTCLVPWLSLPRILCSSCNIAIENHLKQYVY